MKAIISAYIILFAIIFNSNIKIHERENINSVVLTPFFLKILSFLSDALPSNFDSLYNWKTRDMLRDGRDLNYFNTN